MGAVLGSLVLVWLCWYGSKVWSGLIAVPAILFFALIWRFSDAMGSVGGPMARSCGFVGLAIALGSLVSHAIRHSNLLPVVAVVASAVDVWNVFLSGLIAQLQVRAPQVIASASTPLPAPKPPPGVPLSVPLIGFGDFFFLSLFFAVVWRLHLNKRATFWFAFVGLLLNVLLISLPLGLPAIPGLPIIALSILIPNWRYLRYSPDERRALVVGGAFFVVLLAALAYAVKVTLGQ